MNAVSELHTTLTGYSGPPASETVPVGWPSCACRQRMVNRWGVVEPESTPSPLQVPASRDASATVSAGARSTDPGRGAAAPPDLDAPPNARAAPRVAQRTS